MPKLPWFKFNPSWWLTDAELSKCSPATRGVWIDLLCAMHQSGRSGELSGTTDQLARLTRSSTAELSRALTELQTTGAADVTFRNSIVTVINRLMKQEAKSRQAGALRVKKHRSNGQCNADETPEKIEDRSKKIEKKEEGSGAGAPPSFKKWTEKEFYTSIAGFAKDYPKGMCRSFFEYWKEPSATGIMRFQLQKTWDTALRLKTWQRRDTIFPKKNEPPAGPARNTARESKDAELLKTVNG